MQTRLSFTEFKRALSNRAIPLESLSGYLELDPASAVPRLQFTNDALLDAPPVGFDIDNYIQDLLQDLDESEYVNEEKFRLIGKKTVLAEGDSWMNLPWFMGWKSIGDALKTRHNFKVRNIGKWGHTISQMVEERDQKRGYMRELNKKKPDYFIFSGGGNDLQDKLKVGGIIKKYDPKLSVDEYLTDDGKAALSEIEKLYRQMITEVTSTFPEMKIFTYSYDFPRPLLKDGKYLGKHLRARDIPDDKMSPILNALMNKLDVSIKNVVDDFDAAYHIDCFGATKNFTWRNDFHPKNKGFIQITKLFEQAMHKV